MKNFEKAFDAILPKFATAAEERTHRKQRLTAAFRLFGKLGYDEGVAGHITVRDPEKTDHFWVNPFGMDFNEIKPQDLLLIDHHGDIIEGNRPLNRAAFAIHSAIHRARPDVIAAAHAHAIHGRTFSALGKLLEPINQDACAFFEDHQLYDQYSGVVLEENYGDDIAKALGKSKAVIMKNHGWITTGQSVDEAVWWFISAEKCCHAQLMADAAGKPISIPRDTAVLTRNQIGTPLAGWFSFQPLYSRVVREQPDLLG